MPYSIFSLICIILKLFYAPTNRKLLNHIPDLSGKPNIKIDHVIDTPALSVSTLIQTTNYDHQKYGVFRDMLTNP